MRRLRILKQKFSKINGFSKMSIKLGAYTMLCFYMVGLTAYIIAPYVPNYFGAMSVFRGSIEAAPASLASGVLAAFICDIALKSRSRDD